MNTDILKNRKAQLLGFFLVSAFAGGISAFSMAPTYYWPLLMAGLGTLFFIQNKLPNSISALFSGWLFGFFYFVFSLSWIGNALLVEGNDYAWAWPLAVSGLPALLAFFPAIACLLAKRFFSKTETSHFIAFVALLSLFEWLRGHLFTGFPWNLYGYSWGGILEMLQIVYLGDVYILTFLTVFWGVSFGYMFLKRHSFKNVCVIALIVILSAGSVFAYGSYRLDNLHDNTLQNKTVRIVQPNINQAEKWKRDKMMGHFERMIALSMPDGTEDETTFIIWPETATSYLFLDNEYALTQLRDVLGAYEENVYLITGALLRDEDGAPSNSMIVLDKNARIIKRYDKSHLVPFGEYIPFQKYIPIETVSGFSGFKRGDGATTISLEEDFSLSPLICYEILFPSHVVDRKNPSNAIINLTNDGWYGKSAGPHQHLLKAQFRAIEEGIPVIRVANTGFSTIIDPYGRITYKTELFKESTAAKNIPVKIAPFKKSGYISSYILLILTVLLLFMCKRFD